MASFKEVADMREFAARKKRAPPPPQNARPGQAAKRHVNNAQKGRSEVRHQKSRLHAA